MGQGGVIGVFVSGSGSNLQAIIDSCEAGIIPARVGLVISDKVDAYGLERASRHGIPVFHVKVGRNGSPRYDHADSEHVRLLREHGADLICLAGYMRRIGPRVLDEYPGAVMNIHPALLPSFIGASGQSDAAGYGVKIAGCTVHFADEEFDRGPIIVQAAVPVFNDDDAETLAARILTQEHRIYPQAIRWFYEGRLVVEGRKVRVLNAGERSDECLISPPLELRTAEGR